MARRSSFPKRCLVFILAVCINLNLANGSIVMPQTENPTPPTPEQLDKLLAPIALYPDSLLMQILAASVNSQEVLDGGNWLLQNKSLEGDQLDGAAVISNFAAKCSSASAGCNSGRPAEHGRNCRLCL